MRDTKQSVLLIGFGVLVGCGAMVIWPFAPFRSTTKDWVDIATAVGTCGAVGVALWVALRQEALRRREDMLRARLMGAYLSSRLATMLDSAKKTRAILKEPITTLPHGEKFRLANGASHPMKFAVLPEQIAALAPLPDDVAFRLARAVAIMNAVSAELPAYPANVDGAEIGRTARLTARYDSWIVHLDDAINLAESALDRLVTVREDLVLSGPQ